MMPAIDVTILLPPLIAGLLVTATHVPLGREVLARGIIFIDLAVAQIAATGVILAYVLGLQTSGWAIQLAAAASALLGALILRWTERHWPDIQEAIIGSAFVLAASAAVILTAGNPHGAERIKDLLAGQILWTGYQHLGYIGLLYIAVLAYWFLLKQTGRLSFYILFAITVTASVQIVGLYLVFATLIIPALAIRKMPQKTALIFGYLIGTGGYASGLMLSVITDLPAGPLIVWMLAICALIANRLYRPAASC